MRKYIRMTASSNFGNVLSVLVACAFLPFLPMLPLQLLVQNLLYDFSQTGIPFDNVDADLLGKPLAWNPKAQAEGRRYKVFCASLADVFEDRPELVEWRRDLLDLIIRTPRLDWLLLTKRPENVNRMIEEATGFSEAAMWFHAVSHVWIGTSVENQEQAFKRIGHLVAIPAAIRFVSAEPLLGPLNISRWLGYRADMSPRTGIDWVIVGGESGHGARPMHPDWARSLRDQCVAAGVAFHFKQWGEWVPSDQVDEDHIDTYQHPDRSSTGLFDWWKPGKVKAGRALDGHTWDEFPAVQP
jgi:protein gp37